MNPIVHIQDSFLDNITAARTLLSLCEFKAVKSVDGILYPCICENIPKEIEYEFLYKLERALSCKIEAQYLFAREMPEGVISPNSIHSDRDMGAYTAHLCFSEGSWTDFHTHPDLGSVATSETSQEAIQAGLMGFSPYLSVYHQPNRLIVHHAAPFHCAEPKSGFGLSGKNARLVLTCFFNVS